MSEWARDYFERGYGQRWGLRAPSEQLRQDASGLGMLLGLAPSHRVVDIGCGHGKYALALAESGANVVGLDFAANLLGRAKDLATDLQKPVCWVRGDMRRLPLRSGCADAAIVMDAFGFFDTDAEDEAVLREAARVLRIGGRLALKVVNGALVLADFRAAEREERDGVVVHVENTLALDPPRLTQRLRISGSRGEGEYVRRQRLYRVEELLGALEGVGLSEVGVFADPDGTPFEAGASSTMWVVGTKG
jgi:SAM-dependent methyltransferase